MEKDLLLKYGGGSTYCCPCCPCPCCNIMGSVVILSTLIHPLKKRRRPSLATPGHLWGTSLQEVNQPCSSSQLGVSHHLLLRLNLSSSSALALTRPTIYKTAGTPQITLSNINLSYLNNYSYCYNHIYPPLRNQVEVDWLYSKTPYTLLS